MAELKFEIVEHLGVIKEKNGGWNKELNLVSWGNGAPKYDIRDWSSDHKKMSKGATLTEEELLELYHLIERLFFPGNESNAQLRENDSPEKENKYNEAFLEELTKLEDALEVDFNEDAGD